MSAHRNPVEVTDEQLRLALRQLRRPTWPADAQACLDHAIYGPLVRVQARRMARASPTPGINPPQRPQTIESTVPPTPTQDEVRSPRRGFKPAQAGLPFDARRAAANDFDRD